MSISGDSNPGRGVGGRALWCWKDRKRIEIEEEVQLLFKRGDTHGRVAHMKHM